MNDINISVSLENRRIKEEKNLIEWVEKSNKKCSILLVTSEFKSFDRFEQYSEEKHQKRITIGRKAMFLKYP